MRLALLSVLSVLSVVLVVLVVMGARQSIVPEPCSPFSHNGHLGQQKEGMKSTRSGQSQAGSDPTDSSASRTFTCIDMQSPASWEMAGEGGLLWLQHVHERSQGPASNPGNVSDTLHYSSLAELGKSAQVAHNYKLEQLLWESRMAGQTHKTHQRQRDHRQVETKQRPGISSSAFHLYFMRFVFALHSTRFSTLLIAAKSQRIRHHSLPLTSQCEFDMELS